MAGLTGPIEQVVPILAAFAAASCVLGSATEHADALASNEEHMRQIWALGAHIGSSRYLGTALGASNINSIRSRGASQAVLILGVEGVPRQALAAAILLSADTVLLAGRTVLAVEILGGVTDLLGGGGEEQGEQNESEKRVHRQL